MTYEWNKAKEVLKNGIHFAVFSTTWCPDCKMMKPIIVEALNEINNKRDDKIELVEIDAEEAQLFRKSEEGISVLKVPSMFIVVDGVYNHIGYEYIPVEVIVEKVEEAVKK